MKAGFLDTCQRTAGRVVNCGCVFAHLTSRSPYDTPAGFEAIVTDAATFIRTGDRSLIPRVYIVAIRDCRL
jgi:hypothetical protein